MKQDIESGKRLPNGIRLLPNGKYVVSVCVNYKRRSRQARSIEEALTVRSELLNELEMGIEGKRLPAKKRTHRVDDGKRGTSWTIEAALERTSTMYWHEGQGGSECAIRNAKEVCAFFGPRTRLD